MNPKFHYTLFLIFLTCSPFRAEDWEEEHERWERAAGDPCDTLMDRIRAIFTTFLTKDAMKSVFIFFINKVF